MAVSFGSFRSLLKCHFLRDVTLGEEVTTPHHNLSQLYVIACIPIQKVLIYLYPCGLSAHTEFNKSREVMCFSLLDPQCLEAGLA